MTPRRPPTALVTGASGQIGRALRATAPAAWRVVGCDHGALDITHPESVAAALGRERPALVINAAAYTAVDAAEREAEGAEAVNSLGPAHLAEEARRVGARLIHLSTDFVFDGVQGRPYEPGDRPAPLSVYGRTKLAGEQAVREALPDRGYVVRTAWLYGPGGGNFVSTMIRLEGERDTVDVVDDQHGQPTSTLALSRQLLALGEAATAGRAPAGVYHATASGETTWFGLARAVFELIGADPSRVRPTDSAAFVRPAPRPPYSVLGHDAWERAGLSAAPDWHDGLVEVLPSLRA